MKYLKTFEYLIKKTDPVAVNNPLRDFAERLKKIIEKFKDSDLAGHVTFTKGERSALATKASEIL